MTAFTAEQLPAADTQSAGLVFTAIATSGNASIYTCGAYEIALCTVGFGIPRATLSRDGQELGRWHGGGALEFATAAAKRHASLSAGGVVAKEQGSPVE